MNQENFSPSSQDASKKERYLSEEEKEKVFELFEQLSPGEREEVIRQWTKNSEDHVGGEVEEDIEESGLNEEKIGNVESWEQNEDVSSETNSKDEEKIQQLREELGIADQTKGESQHGNLRSSYEIAMDRPDRDPESGVGSGEESLEQSYGGENKFEAFESVVEGCQSFEDLYGVIDSKVRSIGGSEREYSKEELINIIKDVENGARDVRQVTREFGLRLKVNELILDRFGKDVEGASSFEDLHRAIDSMKGVIVGSKREYKSGYLQKLLTEIENLERDPMYMPRNQGLRKKVLELLKS